METDSAQSTRQQDGSQAGMNAIYLVACALHEQLPDATCVQAMDLGAVYSVAKKHAVCALVATPLLALWAKHPEYAAGEEDKQLWNQADASAAARYLSRTYEYRRLSDWMEDAGIWHMPLKGTVLCQHYPSPHIRECSDIDVLFDTTYRTTVREHFQAEGFDADTFEHHDIYRKRPFALFEMHRGLVERDADQSWAEYYRNIEKRLLSMEGRTFERRFSNEEFYVYQVVHAAKHAQHGGGGIRALADAYVVQDAMGQHMDWGAVDAVMDTLGLSAYEQACRSLSTKLFSNPDSLVQVRFDAVDLHLSSEEAALLSATLAGNVYGNMHISIQNQLQARQDKGAGKTRAKISYALHRAFPPYENMARYHDTLQNHPWMLPFFWIKRLASAATKKDKWHELHELRRM